jgi:endoglucanase
MCDWPLVQQMFRAAEDNGIKYQREILLAGGTDATSMQKVAAGVRAGCISIPMRYLHTSAEMFDMADADACVALTVALSRDASLGH